MRFSITARSVWVAALLVSATGWAPAQAETNLNFVLGSKFLDSNDWPVGDSQGSLALLSTFGPSSWPVQVAIDVLGSGSAQWTTDYSQSGVEIWEEDIIQSTFELDVGVRKIWGRRQARPFVGGGLAIIWGRQDRTLPFPPPPFDDGQDIITRPWVIVSASDEAPGAWVDGGVFWRLGKRFNLGFEARISAAELTLSGRKVQAGGVSLGLILGWGWGGGARIVK